jgi:hypothetical protein
LFFNQYVNPIVLEALAWEYYFVYIGALIVLIVCIYFFYSETKVPMLEEVAEILMIPALACPALKLNLRGFRTAESTRRRDLRRYREGLDVGGCWVNG